MLYFPPLHRTITENLNKSLFAVLICSGCRAFQGGPPCQRRHQAHGRGWRQLRTPGEVSVGICDDSTITIFDTLTPSAIAEFRASLRTGGEILSQSNARFGA